MRDLFSRAIRRLGLSTADLLVVGAWLVMAVYFSYARSLWGDEMVRFEQQQLGFAGGFKALFTEPSPFSPGETFLIWLSGAVFGKVLPLEVWGRLPSVLWGAGSLLVAVSMNLRPLRWLVFFSVSLVSFSTEMRTYGSLIFSGALAFKILWDQEKPLSRGMSAALWLTLVFTHIYGICFVGLACFFKKLWAHWAFAVVFVIGILCCYDIPHRTGGITQSFGEITRQTLGTLGNPHKATFILAPAALIGALVLVRKQPRVALHVGVLIVASVLGPIAANVRAHFPFLPRQALGGMFAYLALCALGFESISAKVKRPALVALVMAMGTVIPWTRSILLRQPPFPNQPMHKFKDLAAEIAGTHRKSVLLLDPCNETNFVMYLSKALGERPTAPRAKASRFENLEISTVCWESGACLHTLHDMIYCSLGADQFGVGTPVERLIASGTPDFDFIVHSLEDLPLPASGVETRRSW